MNCGKFVDVGFKPRLQQNDHLAPPSCSPRFTPVPLSVRSAAARRIAEVRFNRAILGQIGAKECARVLSHDLQGPRRIHVEARERSREAALANASLLP